jgi:sterol 24-C-methyltransferase
MMHEEKPRSKQMSGLGNHGLATNQAGSRPARPSKKKLSLAPLFSPLQIRAIASHPPSTISRPSQLINMGKREIKEPRPKRRGLARRWIAAIVTFVAAAFVGTFSPFFTAVFAMLTTSIALLRNHSSDNPTVQEYYSSLESRLGYRLLLGNSRHCGLYPNGTISPFPISKAHRAMEEKLYNRLALKPGAKVLDAGAGSGYVAMYMARKGLNVHAIDITPIHVADAIRNVKANGLEDNISVSFEDYHNLTSFVDNSFDGIYTMETFVHADDPVKVLQNFYRLLKPGGVLVLHEADFSRNSDTLQEVLRLSHCQNTLERGGYEKLLKQTGFTAYDLEDLTDNVLPLWRFFGVVGYVPYRVFKLLGIAHVFTNVMAGVEAWLNWKDGRYISVRAVKP